MVLRFNPAGFNELIVTDTGKVMEKSQVNADENLKSLQSSSSIIAVAIKGNKQSNYVLKWALNKFAPEGKIIFKLIHVQAAIKGVPTPMGNVIPISQVRNDVAAAFKKEMEWQTSQLLLHFKNMCDQRKVQVDVVMIESDDVATAIAKEVAKGSLTKLVIGASSLGFFASKQKGLSAKISLCTPRFCTVYAVSKGKLSSVRQADIQTDGSIADDRSESSFSTNSSSNYTSTSQTDSGSLASSSRNASLALQRFQSLSTINQTLKRTKSCLAELETNHSSHNSLDYGKENNVTSPPLKSSLLEVEIDHSGHQSLDHGKENNVTSSPLKSDIGDPISRVSSCRTTRSDTESWVAEQIVTTDVPLATEFSSPNNQDQTNFNLELEKLRIELRRAQGLHLAAQSENIDASRKVNDLSKRRLEESMKLEEVIAKEEKAKELAVREREKYETVKRDAEYLKECAEREAAERKGVEIKAVLAAQEKKKLEDALSGSSPQYREFEWDEIVSATSSFSEDLKIGMGAHGTVYKSNLFHTTVAVKVLHSNGSHKNKHFLQEVEIFSRIRHPNLLLLLGACPDRGCLVYEYMDNGSLDDRLLRKNGTPSIPWFARYRIAWEVASALAFLHNSKPMSIIHRDMKPANILLDRNLVSKISDVGLSTMLDSDNLSTIYKDSGPVGTLCYIDPEYQRTGLISPKSDVYAFGMVILQLLTAKPAIALTHVVETAIENGNLTDILDPEAGSWPFQETLELARLGLNCAELRRRDRPDLKDHVIPTLERLKKVADRGQDSASACTSSVISRPPSHFICPILQDVMDDPCVAADGYTYDRKAIEIWFQENNKSPMTNMALPHKSLIPNYTLLSAIVEWKSRQ
ncbi:hypothetical protein L6164_023308 [Bauhinia variegata]|uniref:Uncharacterized protein n=1 Tax=Bauhinia variegata TaxID=167791 RepID=A0ACB9MHY4_BAUVA|nr:hypothetical protein L6164_023308 [Bauhinia variegata]